MDNSTPDRLQPRSHLFTVRLWLEDVGEGQEEVRGQVHHVLSGEARYFRAWSTLRGFFDHYVAGSTKTNAVE